MTKVKRSASFPPQFEALFVQVVNTNAPVIINNLGPNRTAYTTLRARLNEYRRAFRIEAYASGNTALVSIADKLDSVTVKTPVQTSDGWMLELCPREYEFASAISEVLSAQPPQGTPDIAPTSETDERVERELEGAKAISELFDEPASHKDPDNDNA